MGMSGMEREEERKALLQYLTANTFKNGADNDKQSDISNASNENTDNQDTTYKEFASVAKESNTPPILICSDALTALVAGTNGKLEGIIMIAGTGMVAMGFNAATATDDNSLSPSCRAGGWGPLFDDVGSGFWIGLQGLSAAAKAYDKVEEETMLLDEIVQHLQFPNAPAMISWAYKQSGWSHIASIASVVLSCYAKHDKVAVSIINNAVEGLLKHIIAIAKKMNVLDKPYPVVFAGGLLTNEDSVMGKLLTQRLKEEYPMAVVQMPKYPISTAAAMFAKVCAEQP